ncbi:MAG: GNAT family N-acetyltransferase [Acidobacteriales bacterium]|nr:GNAT family N-acetyltransferase [Terriglobales bacterium]
MKIEPITLEGKWVRLEPLRVEHAPALWEVAGADAEDIFRWFPYRMANADDFRLWVENALREQQQGVSLPFATIERASGTAIGGTRFMNIDRANQRVEIGSTWIAPKWQRTAINTEAKLLMARHAFEIWKCIRLELKTDALNVRSRKAILRIGGREEGTFRRHLVTHTGRVRDSVYFSILDSEWPGMKGHLESILATHPRTT